MTVDAFNRGRSGRGFTLIEVLVVVAIIALLIAILLPSLARARHQSRRAVCGTQIGQLGKAWLMYAQTERGFFPSGEDFGFGNWTLLEQKQRDIFEKGRYGLKGGNAFYCPYYLPRRGSKPEDDWQVPRPDLLPTLVYNISYVVYAAQPRAVLENDSYQAIARARGRSRPNVEPPVKDTDRLLDRRPLLFDEVSYYAPGGQYGSDGFNYAQHLEFGSTPAGGNAVFGDGHVDWRRFKSRTNCDPGILDYSCAPGLMMPMMNNPDFSRFF